MKLVSRSDLGWPPSAAADWPTADGVKIHYEGTAVHVSSDHNLCVQEWKDIRASHLANTSEGYVDIAYNFGACPHGYVFEGRGLRKKTGANGNQTLNGAHYSIVGFLGDSGDTQPNDLMLGALRDAIDYFQANGAGGEIKGHRDGYATSCPGDPLYSWVQNGAPRPSGGTTPTPAPSPTPNHPWPGLYVSMGATGDIVKTIQAQMLKRGWSGIGSADGVAGPKFDKVIRQFQSEKGLTVDGVVGPKTWSAIWNSPIT